MPIGDGCSARALIETLAGTVHSATGNEPVVVEELKFALTKGKLDAADMMAHNYEYHARVTSADLCSPSCRGEREV